MPAGAGIEQTVVEAARPRLGLTLKALETEFVDQEQGYWCQF